MDGADDVDVSTYRTDDGTVVRHRIEDFHLVSQAHDRILALANQATRVIERGPKTDKNGKTIGERVVFLSAKSMANIAWTDDHTVRVIDSTKLAYALEFERRLNETGRLGPDQASAH